MNELGGAIYSILYVSNSTDNRPKNYTFLLISGKGPNKFRFNLFEISLLT